MLHGSRSGLVGRPLSAEYDATRRYCVSNTADLSWHATIGDDCYSVHLPADHWGWHARAASRQWLGVEFAQPTADDTITDGQVRAVVHWLTTVVLSRWPTFEVSARTLLTHAEVERLGLTGATDGKTDCYPYGDIRAGELRQRILSRLYESTLRRA